MSGDAVHPAARAFSEVADRYESGRPSYPSEAVSWLVDRLGVNADVKVADVAAGTGKLTRLLTPTGARVLAVEPLRTMIDVLRTTTPHAEPVVASAERLPLVDGAVNAITVAQAFHWFDADRAWAEFRRVLVPGGGVGLIWNARDRSVEWVDAVWRVMDEVERTAPWRNHEHPELSAGLGFSPFVEATFEHQVRVTTEAMIDRIASVSHVAALPEIERRTVLERIVAALPDEREMVVPYRVDAYVTYRT